MPNHTLKLATEPFNAIVFGSKRIESRLFDKKRQLIHVGDQLTFVNRENPEEKVSVVVTELLLFPTFNQLFSSQDAVLFGLHSRQALLDQIHTLYSPDQESKNGVVGIRFEFVVA